MTDVATHKNLLRAFLTKIEPIFLFPAVALALLDFPVYNEFSVI